MRDVPANREATFDRIAVRHDHRLQYMVHHFQHELAVLGIESSPAFVRAPEGNGCAGRFIGMPTEDLRCARTFATAKELRLGPVAFRETYNASSLIEQHGFKLPATILQEQTQSTALAV